MTWYAAHIVMQMVLNGRDDVLAWESIVLLQAETVEDAYAKADTIGRMGEGDSNGSMSWDGAPAYLVYRGTRRLVSISNSTDIYNNPGDSCEITYMQLELESEDAFKKFMAGDGPACLLE